MTLVKLSKTSKMPCKSWSLEARTTCPGSVNPESGEVYGVCQDCYATKGFFRFPVVKASRDHNRNDWKRSDWCTDMVKAIRKDKYFRWFDSGDVYTPELARKILVIIQATPNTKHWIPTKSWDIHKLRVWLDKINLEPNAVVRFSWKSIIKPDGVLPNFGNSKGSCVMDSTYYDMSEGYQFCPAYTNKGKCGDCRACWNKSVDLVVYPLH